ncbi:DUF2326 domain-containing protein [Rhodococcoides yunnanense]|uniref:DUF2326 domain-containing protein n=1 Tax=Rhodococcoides yunnanense TaxID=278209 RepID=UPI0022B1E96B|nr:DUF2326 domain-containing protein [Rhodococcus yunnanensis]MCZ4279001.1 DUF2326 domain-containing protein [Rhodococcus yunnanensis]
MIRRISANNPDFQPISFGAGVNLIVAERDPDATSQHSRNARGKTSILQAINYCLGSARPTSFKPLADNGWSFTLEFDLFGSTISATRETKGGSRVSIQLERSQSNTVVADLLRDDQTVSLPEWKFLLGLGLFGLDEEFPPGSNGISPRTLLSYVIRLDAPRDPTKILAQQPAWSSRQHVAFLLGLNWRYTQEMSRMERDAEAFAALSYAKEVQLVPGLIEDESDLLLKRAEIEREVQETRRLAENFIVLEDPQGTVAESNRLATELTEVSDKQISDERLLTLYKDSLADAAEPNDTSNDQEIGDVYRELGLVFSQEALRRYEDVESFHRSISRNRRNFIETEMDRLDRDIKARQPVIDSLQLRRQVLLRQLSSGGGVDDLLELQRRVSESESRLTAVDEAIALVRSVNAAKDALGVRQATCRRDAREGLNTDRTFLDKVNARFSEMIGDLYGRSASITADVDSLGYKFSTKVSGSSSSGVTKIQLFAFDLTLMGESRQNHHPRFLIHDSVVFDGVDPRQIAGALNLAHQSAETSGNQYIATMNTNDIPEEILTSHWYESAVRRVILDTELGGAFGLEF